MLVMRMKKSLITRLVERAEPSTSLRLLAAGACVILSLNIMSQYIETQTIISMASSSSSQLRGVAMQHQNSRITRDVDGKSEHATPTVMKEKIPLFIGAGQGTTGTRSVNRAFCRLGIPSVHWNTFCVDQNPYGDQASSPLFERGIHHHYKAVEAYLQLGNCAIFHRQQSRQTNNTQVATMACTEDEFDNLSSSLHHHVAEVVRSGIASLHDVPYAQMVPYIMDIAQQESIPTMIIFSEREPQAWVTSRTSHHATQTDVVCQDVEHAFDITHCLNKRKEYRSDNLVGDNNDDVGEIASLFLAYSEFQEGSDERQGLLDFAATAMAQHQDKIKGMTPIYQVNFWTESIDDSTLPGIIWRATKHSISPDAKKVFISQSRHGGLKKGQNEKAVARLEKLGKLRESDEEKSKPQVPANESSTLDGSTTNLAIS